MCKGCFRPYFRVFHLICVLGHRAPGVGGRGCSPKGLVHNLLLQLFTLGNSKIEVSETSFLDTVITQNDHPRYVKDVLGRISVFFTLCGYWAHGGGGGGGGQRIGAQLAYAVFQAIQLKNGNHLAEAVRSKPGRPVYRGKRHITPHFGPFCAYSRTLPCKIIILSNKHIPQ